MPSAKTHDAITLLLAAPTFVCSYAVTQNSLLSAVVTAAFIFGGLMFGPDLDTMSKQYTRWGILRPMWLPYRTFFKHRSRWSHGLIFGTLFRVIYFLGIVTILIFASSHAASHLLGNELPDALTFVREWTNAGAFFSSTFGHEFLPATFIGLWLGAASHTFADMAITYIKTGRVMRYL